jgi:hypothetical protein
VVNPFVGHERPWSIRMGIAGLYFGALRASVSAYDRPGARFGGRGACARGPGVALKFGRESASEIGGVFASAITFFAQQMSKERGRRISM